MLTKFRNMGGYESLTVGLEEISLMQTLTGLVLPSKSIRKLCFFQVIILYSLIGGRGWERSSEPTGRSSLTMHFFLEF